MVMLPNGVTLLNLFFGIFAIVAAARGDFGRAVLYIVIGGLFDGLDGRVARATNTGSRFGIELDSLVDAISFGLAPAMIMYFAVLHKEGWDWLFVFGFCAAAVIRLARFNVEQGGRAKTHFRGLPSPAAGGTLATYYWFSQTPLYNETLIGDWPWHQFMRFLMAGLAFLMVSDVPYPAWPTFSLRTAKGAIGLVVFIALALGLIFLPREFFFPVGMTYVLFGIVSATVRGLLDKPATEFEPNPLLGDAGFGDDRDSEPDDAPSEELARQHRTQRSGVDRRRHPHIDHPTPPDSTS
jgi:CDP-diacylglycerol--serine O-phosphatidyltransferase